MRKNILILFFLLFPSIVHGGICVSGENYKIINYITLNNEVRIKGGGFYDIFLFGPFFQTDNVQILGIHYINSWSKTCEYYGFNELNNLTYNDLLKDDKFIFLGNFIISFLFIFGIVILLILGYIKGKKYKSFKFYK